MTKSVPMRGAFKSRISNETREVRWVAVTGSAIFLANRSNRRLPKRDGEQWLFKPITRIAFYHGLPLILVRLIGRAEGLRRNGDRLSRANA